MNSILNSDVTLSLLNIIYSCASSFSQYSSSSSDTLIRATRVSRYSDVPNNRGARITV